LFSCGEKIKLFQEWHEGKLLVLTKLVVLPYKVRGLETSHLRAGPPFSCMSLGGNIFSSFFSQREIDEESYTSGFIFFEALLN